MRAAAALTIFLLVPTLLSAQDWREELQSDLVVHRDGKMIIEEYSMERLNLPGYEPLELQVKFYAEAPHDDTISRDKFVGMSTYLLLSVLHTIEHELGAGGMATVYLATDLKHERKPHGE